MGFLGSMFGGPPNPFGGGNPISDPFGWPSGVPNPLGLPSPGQVGSSVGGWFSNPYGTNGTQGNQNPWGGINPYGTQLSGPKWDSGTVMPTYSGDTTLGQSSSGFGNLQKRGGQPIDPISMKPAHAWAAPPAVHGPQTPQATQGMWTGGVGTGGPFGRVWEQQTGSGPWTTPQPGQSGYKAPGVNPMNFGLLK